MYAEVAIINASPEYDRLYIYIVPPALGELKPGNLVRVPFGRRQNVKGVVTGLAEEPANAQEHEFREILGIENTLSELTDEMKRVLIWMKQRYFCTYYDALKLMLPLGLPAAGRTAYIVGLSISIEQAREHINSDMLDNIKQIRIIENLVENQEMPLAEICAAASVSPSVVKTLEKKGLVSIRKVAAPRKVTVHTSGKNYTKPSLNDDQRCVFEALKGRLGAYSAQLLYGVTGSGKTEIYLRLIEETINMGKSAIVLVPEIALTPDMLGAVSARFGNDAAIFHSRLTPAERREAWIDAASGRKKIVVGARSAVFAPLKNLGIIVMDEEHDYSYKSESMPKYNAKEIARKRAEASDALLLFGSATPLVETYWKAAGAGTLHVLSKRAADASMPAIMLVDMKEELKNGNTSVLSSLLAEEMKISLSSGGKTMLLLNRRGYNSLMLCRSCGVIYKCVNCTVAMKFHKNPDRLICHHCGHTVIPTVCPACGSQELYGTGYGTQFAENEIRKAFPDVPIFRLDADTQGIYRAAGTVIENYRKEKAAILIGTQLIAKGHDIEDVTLVGVLNADMALTSDDFRASERTFSLISQVAGRAGRGRLAGKAVVQAIDTDDYSIIDSLKNDYESFYRDEIKMRKIMGYPPFKVIAVIEMKSEDREMLDTIKGSAVLMLAKNAGNCEIIGPYDPYVNMIAGRHRARILLKSSSLKEIISCLSEFEANDAAPIRKSGISMTYDVDPYQILT